MEDLRTEFATSAAPFGLPPVGIERVKGGKAGGKGQVKNKNGKGKSKGKEQKGKGKSLAEQNQWSSTSPTWGKASYGGRGGC